MARSISSAPLALCLNRGMALEDNWHAHLVRIVLAEGSGNRRAGYRAVAGKTGSSEEYVYQLTERKPKAGGAPRQITFDFKRKLAIAYAHGRDETWIDKPLEPEEPSRPTLGEALPVVLDALAAVHDREYLRDVLNLIARRDSPETRQVLAAMLSGATPAVTINPAAPTHQDELDRLSREAEQRHANSTAHKRRRTSGG